MLSIQLIREQSDLVQAALSRRHMDTALDQILTLDQEHRKLLHESEDLRAKRNEVSKNLGRVKNESPEAFERLRAEMREVGDRISTLETAISEQESRLQDLLLQLPNLPDASVPEGESEENNAVVRSEGTPRAFEFTPLPHWDLGERLDIIDFDRGVKLSGSRFYVLKGPGARLQRALITWMLDVHIARGYTEVYVPALVKGEVMQGAGQLPKFFDNLYRDAEEDLYLIPTAEVPVTNLYRDEILSPGSLPIYHVAYTPCFRREKVSAGRDVRGIKRVHQFDKVEMYKFVEPDRSYEELEGMLADAEALCRMLDIPHRVVQICAGDLGFSAAKTYDIELWAPGCAEWLEVSSVSNCTDFQARRANLRYRPEPNARPQFMHTLNGSGLALPRTMIAVLETYQQPDGSVVVPDALRPYMGGIETIR
ncbi:MAG TPA: serine--tRNA ligase [Dehalococcoidia bacterium]|nr:serine--tRNA ligase [Dehalococcoidia bacterium]